MSDLTKRLFSSGVKDVINTAAKSAIAQKVTNAVVSGATTEAEKALKNAVTKGVNPCTTKDMYGRLFFQHIPLEG